MTCASRHFYAECVDLSAGLAARVAGEIYQPLRTWRIQPPAPAWSPRR